MGIIAMLGQIIKTVVVIGFLSLFLEILLPNGNLKKYSKFVMGLLVVIAIINPMLRVFTGGLPEIVLESNAKANNTDTILAAGQGLNQNLQSQGELYYEENLTQQITALVMLIDGVKSADVQVYLTDEHNLARVVITLTMADKTFAKPGSEFASKSDDKETNKETNKETSKEMIKEIREKTAESISTFYSLPPEQVEVSINSYS